MLSFTDLATDLVTANAYATARVWSDWTGSDAVKTAALRRGQDYIAATFNARWLEEWDNADAPEEVQYAIIEAARRELVKPGSMQPDLKRGGAIKSVKAGSVQVDYESNAPRETTFKAIEGLLSGHVAAKSTASLLVRF